MVGAARHNYFMNLIKSLLAGTMPTRLLVPMLFCAGTIAPALRADPTNSIPVLQIKADQVTAKVSPTLYGLMTEEINYSYEGGLYGELVRNRAFKASKLSPRFWDTVGGAVIDLDTNTPLNEALNVSLKLDASQATAAAPAGIANSGYWGIPVRPKTTYHASFYAKAAPGFTGPLTVAIVGTNGGKTFASAQVTGITGDWQKYEVTLTTKNVKPSKSNRLVITTTIPGTLWLQQVSLFPPTYVNRANGNRPDIMQLLADMQPKFLRLPGGNYLEGNTIATRFNWKTTIGDVDHRPGHMDDAWGYWSTDGFGLMEYLHWCEDLHMEPVLAVYAGYALHHDFIKPGPDLEPYVQDDLDEIEYLIGDTTTTWGAQRAKDGHPAPFPLHYIEVGNEDWFDKSGSYEGRFAQIFDAIKAKYPQLQVIATAKVKTRTPDVLDEHYYRSQEEMEAHAHDYDAYPRDAKTKIFVGEWATRVGSPTPNMAGALGDAAWMTGMERNSDIVLISSYAPMFVNVSDLKAGGSMQWKSDLIGYDALTSYGSPSYYAQQLFSTHHGDTVLAVAEENIPHYTWQPPAKRRNGVEQPRPKAQEVPALFYDATRDSLTGKITVKVVNRQSTPQPVRITLSGVASVAKKGALVVMQADQPDDTNSIDQPGRIVPKTKTVKGLGTNFTFTFPPYSISILELSAK